MANVFVNGKALSDFGCLPTDAAVYTAPNPLFDKVEIDGRNGDLIIERDKYSNIQIEYPCVILDNFAGNYTTLRSWLLSLKGYVRIEDTFFPDRFRLGRFTGEITPDIFNGHQSKIFTVKFWCKPQWFLKDGEHPIETTNTVDVYNPTYQNALPLIRVYGSGTLTVGAQTITVASGATAYIDIDSEIRDCYEGDTNRNSLVTMPQGFPELEPGATTISITGLTRAVIWPRWWAL